MIVKVVSYVTIVVEAMVKKENDHTFSCFTEDVKLVRCTVEGGVMRPDKQAATKEEALANLLMVGEKLAADMVSAVGIHGMEIASAQALEKEGEKLSRERIPMPPVGQA